MSDEEAQEVQQISIEDLELSLEVYQIESEQKLKKLEELFKEKTLVDPNKMFYEERSSLQIKFQNIISDLTQFLINQQIASTDKLRKTFYRLLQNPLILLFKVSRFEIFNLRLNAFDIQLQPIDAIAQLGASIITNIEGHQLISQKLTSKYTGGQYKSFDQFLQDAKSKLIQDQIFLLYSYLRKGGNIIRKSFEEKVRVVQIYNKIQQKLLKRVLDNNDAKTLKQLSTLNYQLYLLQNSYDVLCFYLKVPFKAVFIESFKQLQNLANKAKQTSNFDLFILIFVRYSKEILAKLQMQGIDTVFTSYIENILTSLLQLWGCRLCHYQQFFQLFQKLLNLHPKKSAALSLCLKHTPDLKKQDIVLLRVHFKHDLLQKHAELLSLLKQKSIQQINGNLRALFHKTLYNLDFETYDRQQLIELLTLLNGNSSLLQFFSIAERAFKQWNHTVDFMHVQKYIEGQFKYPAMNEQKILQSIRLFNNLCILQYKNMQDCQALVGKGSIQKALAGLVSFLLNNENIFELIKVNQLLQNFLIKVLQFLSRTITNGSDWETILLNYSKRLNLFNQVTNSKISQLIRSIIMKRTEAFTIKAAVNIFQNILQNQQASKLCSQSSLKALVTIFMQGTNKQNEQVKKLRLFELDINSDIQITKEQQQFLKKYAVLNGNTIQPKDNGCFILSQLQITTNPVQFDRVMDNYYFILDANSKRFIQLIANSWVDSEGKLYNNSKTVTKIVNKLIQTYPIALPLICSTRVNLPNNISKRFSQILVDYINPQAFEILKSIIQCKTIHYKNGRNYMQQEIIPVILKQTIKLINEGCKKIQLFQLLALCLTHSKTNDIKIDIIQKTIEQINFQISSSQSAVDVYRLCNANYQILKKYFGKKQIDMRKQGLQSLFQKLYWSQIRSKLTPLQTEDNAKLLKKVTILEQIMVTPFIISQQFNTEQIKLQSTASQALQNKSNQTISLKTLKSALPLTAETVLTTLLDRKVQGYKIVDLSSLKYSLQSHLGDQIRALCFKQGIKLVTASSSQQVVPQNNEQNITLVQFYLKQFQNPQVSSQTILKYLFSLINNQITLSTLFTNYANLQKLFSALFILLKYLVKQESSYHKTETTIDNILSYSSADRLKTIKTILTILSDIGYTNLWAQNFNSLKGLTYYKELLQKTGFSDQSEDQSLFSWLLKTILQKPELKVQLNTLLGNIFSSRPKDQNSLMYKVTINKGLLNLIMQSLQIQNLSYVSLIFHSNFNNLRLYTDQLHEGLKAINMSSKNRAFNQYIQLSKDIEDQQFFIPMKLFKQNFSFFIRIQKEGYRFKKGEQEKLGRQRVLKVLRGGATGETLIKQIDQVIIQFQEQLQKLQYNIASRVKSFYLVTKLRDLSYQNALTICQLYEILAQNHLSSEEIINKIKQIEIFSLINQLYNDLVHFQKSNYQNFMIEDRSAAQKQVNICTIRRFSHSMSKVYQKCQLQFDQVFQRCLDGLKLFFTTKQGKNWLEELHVYPPFLSRSFIDFTLCDSYVKNIRTDIVKTLKDVQIIELKAEEESFIGLAKAMRQLKKSQLLSKDKVKISYKRKLWSLSQFLVPLKELLISQQTLTKSKDGFLLLNKYKTSQKTLQQIDILGVIVGYCIFNQIQMDLPLHSSLLAAVGFGVCDLDDLLDIDFKVWEDLRNVTSMNQSKDLNLNFSYIFESIETLQPQRVELIDKGSSKKVNNLNREEYCDLVCCYLLHKTVGKQINRFLEALVYICPKQLLSSLKISQLHQFFIKKSPNYSKQILKRLMKKRGQVLPCSIFIGGRRVQNLKDYQHIQWVSELLDQNSQLKQKIWEDESNIFLSTWMGKDIEVDLTSRIILIGRHNSKEQVRQSLAKALLIK